MAPVMVPFGELLTHLRDAGEHDALESLIDNLELITEGSPNLRRQPFYLYQLAEALNGIYERSGNLAILNRSITYLSNAAALGGALLVSILGQLGLAYKMRYYATKEKSDIEHAVESHRRGVELSSVQSPDFAAELDHYSQALRESFAIDRDPSRLDRAVEMAERALSLLQKDDPRQATVVGNLANHLQTRGRELDRPDDFDRSLRLVDEALAQPSSEKDKAFLSAVRFSTLLAQFDKTGRETALPALKNAWAGLHVADATAINQFNWANNWCRILFAAGQFADVVDGFEVAKRAARELIFVAETSTEGKRTWIESYQWLVLVAAYSLCAPAETSRSVVCDRSGHRHSFCRRLHGLGRGCWNG